ncbi:urea carboxylase [Methylobrevis albus]|uniref:Urea carboxylase n=1 Tax=Methylobrevis albus TaxID=2793297 RepID=A0A931I0T2_9HYPH|nr:urea carboxylase [Methylobrevis albus]MBH0237198.1 urea carboxylase [Methylobrevis albus]
MFRKVLIANRGEIVGRIGRTLKRLGVGSVAVASDADRFTPPVLAADEVVRIGPAPAAESYLRFEKIIEACKATGAEAVHPGYGFLSENVAFAEALAAEGIAFIGPRPEHLSAFGLKHTARALAEAAGVPLLPGSGLLADAAAAVTAARAIGYPVMLKSTAGGGGIGMQLCHDDADLTAKFETVQRMATASFGDARVYLERFVADARHIEVQIFGNGRGDVVALGERDCSLQRRNQKVVEETPAPGITPELREALLAAAVALGRSVAYESAGTVEFVYDVARAEFYFLEVNTRLQVEHPVTELVTGIDLVEWMVRQAAGEDVLAGLPPIVPQGAAMEVRLYAEDALQGFRPSAGRLTRVAFPEGVRVDGWIETGSDVTTFYDPMLAKIIVVGATRAEAAEKLGAALAATEIAGIETNLAYLREIVASPMFRDGAVATSVLARFPYAPRAIEVLSPGAQSSLQELPGRLGLWHVGVPPSGPMDARSFRIANRIVGNAEDAAALELTVAGPTLRFHADAVIGLAGAAMPAKLDGVPVPYGAPVTVAGGQVLNLGTIEGAGQRTYLAVRGAFTAPEVLGSRATFTLGAFGGHATGTLKPGDALHFGAAVPVADPAPQDLADLSREWTLAVVYGPHGAPDFFTDADIATLFSAPYEVHFNSARTGIRLIGPQPEWARSDGGEAGLHPSNLHDNAYAIGAIDFTGDTPIILGPDGPSLGGFVCPAVVAAEDLWKLGQLKPGDTVRFAPVARPDDPVAGPLPAPALSIPDGIGSPILGSDPGAAVPVVYRRQGDRNLLVEYGDMRLDLGLRLRAHALMQALELERPAGIVDLTPGIRSLQVHYDPEVLSRTRLLGLLAELEAGLPPVADVTVPSRIVHLPLSWNDPEVQLAMRKYQELVRPNAPWCPDNIEFIRRINGLDDEAAVKRTIFDASYLVMGLGDVYLGAPVATPVDPRHRLVTTKYNPARTWTPENAVGIGGAYMCVYGMEGPGGYQLFGRTIQMWNTWRTTREFTPGHPWLLRFFDQIRFFEVDGPELAEARAAFPQGAFPIRIEETTLSYADHLAEAARNAAGIAAFEARRQAAFEAERARWKAEGLDGFIAETAGITEAGEIPDGCTALYAHVPGSVWKFVVDEGAVVAAGDPVVIVESMKMEITIPAPAAGRIRAFRSAPGKMVRAGDVVALMEDL